MPEQIIVGPINKGLRNDRTAFIIDNDSFPTLINAFQWRGRVKRKRGTKLLGRLNRFFSSGATTITLSSGSGNLLSGFSIPQANATLVPGQISITDTTATKTYKDLASDGNLIETSGANAGTITGITQASSAVITASGTFSIGNVVYIYGVSGMTQINGLYGTVTNTGIGTITVNINSTNFSAYTMGGNVGLLGGTINYSSGAFTITGAGSDTVTAVFYYYPDLPVMGIRNFRQSQTSITSIDVPARTIAFDTVYSYQVSNTLVGTNYLIYDVSFYKNPAANSFGTTNPQKTNWTPVTWTGQDYELFWTTNFSGAMWATNGTPAMQFQLCGAAMGATGVVYASPTTLTITVPANANVVKGDWIFINEVTDSTTAANAARINQQTGYVSSDPVTAGGFTSFTLTLPFANIANDTYANGMIQYLTNVPSTQPAGIGDGIRWYDGDPTAGGTYPPAQPLGWVNFAPPLSQGTMYSIGGAPPGQYYLVGATMIYPFRDFLIFVGAYISTSSWNPIWLKDTVIFMANGTPYYTASFDNSTQPYSAFKLYHQMLVPTNQTAYPMVGWEDVSGFGGFISSGVAQPITTLVPNEDVLILGYPEAFTRLIYTGNNLIPFLFYRINTELGASSTFSAITFDKGSFTTGNFGVCLTTQVASQRMDLAIPDQIFEINYLNNGYQRVVSGRDYINEWIYITYPSNSVMWKFPNQTLMYNYRDDSWAIHNETYTAYGDFYPESGNTWASVMDPWDGYAEAWNSSLAAIGNAELIGGNQQGFLLIRNNETDEDPSLYVQAINTTSGLVTSPDHCLNDPDPYSGKPNFIIFNNTTGNATAGGQSINGMIFQVVGPIMENSFHTSPKIDGGTYLGGGTITRVYVPFIQTKQFPVAWGNSRKTILGPQKYLFTRTANGQITLNIYLSTDPDTVYNKPDTNDAIVFKQVLYTCPESTNLGLTTANVNLQQINQLSSDGSSSNNQSQIWHRMNTSLIGDTVQVGFTMSNQQMLDASFNNQFAEIEFHSMILDVRAGGLLA